MQRNVMLSGININIPNSLQGAQAFPIMMTSIQVITDDAGQQLGHPMQQQQPIIASDLTPEVLAVLNAQLSYIGFALTPVVAEQGAADA